MKSFTLFQLEESLLKIICYKLSMETFGEASQIKVNLTVVKDSTQEPVLERGIYLTRTKRS